MSQTLNATAEMLARTTSLVVQSVARETGSQLTERVAVVAELLRDDRHPAVSEELKAALRSLFDGVVGFTDYVSALQDQVAACKALHELAADGVPAAAAFDGLLAHYSVTATSGDLTEL
ncbi:hypothetical protein [Rhodococcoides corynebacterioides]|uniref:hypothetical protein n=1 Tax=Rhodococcoides corynebacterioides TaxID=53972 RepID=UPI00082D9816|nr:hypothetical protein [Rhodococcus corynebacterioides]